MVAQALALNLGEDTSDLVNHDSIESLEESPRRREASNIGKNLSFQFSNALNKTKAQNSLTRLNSQRHINTSNHADDGLPISSKS